MALHSGVRRHLLMAALALCGGCASRPESRTTGGWIGRLSLQVQTEPPQSFSASFELDGNAREGQLQLSTPLGHALARARWNASEALLMTASERRSYPNVSDMLLAATGAALPLDALFDWLEGRPTQVPGWTPDLSHLAQGRLQARRSEPAPEVLLRIVLDR